jgi:hypothetical protein
VIPRAQSPLFMPATAVVYSEAEDVTAGAGAGVELNFSMIFSFH